MTVSYQFRKINDLITWHEMALRPEPLADGEFRRHVEESLKRDFGLEGCVENVEGILYELPASICETPYGKLPFNLMMAIFRSRVFWQDAKNQAEAGRIPPKSRLVYLSCVRLPKCFGANSKTFRMYIANCWRSECITRP